MSPRKTKRVSDALLKIQKVPGSETARAGFLADIVPFSPSQINLENEPKAIGPASTFKFIPKNDPLPEDTSPSKDHTIPPGHHWVDCAQPGTVVFIEQPAGQFCASVGGIMAARMKVLGVKGVVVDGRVRDLAELRSTQLQIWARATSTVGTSAEAKPGARNVPVKIGGVTVSPLIPSKSPNLQGDIAFCDPLEGAAVIPAELLDEVLALVPKLAAADEKVKEDVLSGASVFDSFNKHRSI
ncbi:DlpA domain-containing protein [Histoplasma capsulatum]|uniref:DlpA domain-containing protein n=1 Tax=Ajellomyces capsulatus TaxID=5037 RepID=A0A8A1M7Z5_AJECA|nr:DlpA domain-containing protein [Histoplasma capsulatum]